MGLFKKSDDGDDSNRRALFGRKNKSPPANPYAKPIPTNAYTKAKIEAGVAPLPAGEQPLAGGKTPAATATAPIAAPAGPPAGGYAPNKYGNQGGYGTDRFGGGGGGGAAAARSGGYGGLGSDPNDPGDASRDALFGGARDRVQQQQPGAPPPYEEEGNAAGAAYGGGYGGGSNDYNNVYQERQLTAEEEEEEEIQAIKQEMRFVKQGDVASTRNALRVAAQAEETGRETLARLGAQGETIHDTERNLDLATIEGRAAQDKARELKTLNKSMFHVHVANPFTASRRRRDREDLVLNTHRQDRDTREGTRSEAFQANQRMDRTFREIDKDGKRPAGKARANVTERAKYQFEADSEDEGMEDEIEQNLDLLHGAAGRMNGLARATGREINEQNRHLERIAGKVCLPVPYSHICTNTNNHPERLRRRPTGHEQRQTGPDSLINLSIGIASPLLLYNLICSLLYLLTTLTYAYYTPARLPGAVEL